MEVFKREWQKVAKNSLFRSSLGGYSKEDVNRYIDELGIKFSQREDELEGEIKRLKSELEVLPSLIAEKERAKVLDEKLGDLKNEAQGLAKQLEEKTRAFDEASVSLSEVTAQRDALEVRTKELSAECERLHTDVARAKAELEANIRETEALKNQLEDDKNDFEKRAEEMLIQIQAQAKSVIDKANETAELIVSNAKKKSAKGEFEAASPASSKKKDGLSDMLENHKSKMDSFFSAITKAFMGDGK